MMNEKSYLKHNPEYPFILAILILTMFFSCTKYNEYHVQEWQNAFFLNDSTLGVIGWDYDYDESKEDWTPSDYKNVKQIYYEYNLNTNELKEVYTLTTHDLVPSFYRKISLLFPLVFYSTKLADGNNEIAQFNIQTLENKIFKSEQGYSGLYPRIISKKGRYFGYLYAGHPIYRYSVYDLQENKDILDIKTGGPIYIDDDSLKILLLSSLEKPNWFLIYDMTTGTTDTLGENTFGVIENHVTNNITIFRQDGIWKYIKNEDMLKGQFIVDTLENLIIDSPFHVNFNTGKAVSSTENITVVDYLNNQQPIEILKFSITER